jgi:hypothetical protein
MIRLIKQNHIIWRFNPLYKVKLPYESMNLGIQWIEGYPNYRVVIHLMISGDESANVQLTAKNMKVRITSGELTLHQLEIVMWYVENCLKAKFCKNEEKI